MNIVNIKKVKKIIRYLEKEKYPWISSKYSIQSLSDKAKERLRKYINKIHIGSCENVLRKLPTNSIDSLITDPPSGIGFMGKKWDTFDRKEFIKYISEIMTDCYRVMKPGSFGLVWSLPRTSHWTAIALEDAGFELRDCIYHVFGTGFPKSLNINKSLKKREENKEAEFFDGWGTGLKPAVECWWLIRKPLEGNVADNYLKYGTGGINIDSSRIKLLNGDTKQATAGKITVKDGKGLGVDQSGSSYEKGTGATFTTEGRFPSHLVMSHHTDCKKKKCHPDCPVKIMNGYSGITKSQKSKEDYKGIKGTQNIFKGSYGLNKGQLYDDIGGASRFFYCSKPSSKEKGKFNKHPTVKSIELMSYLIKLITPPGGIVLDPFAGSGTTLVSCIHNGFNFIGCEKVKKYHKWIRKRIKLAKEEFLEILKERVEDDKKEKMKEWWK